MFLNRERNVFSILITERSISKSCGGENDDKVSKVMTCSLSLGSFVLAYPGRRKLALSSGFFSSKQLEGNLLLFTAFLSKKYRLSPARL